MSVDFLLFFHPKIFQNISKKPPKITKKIDQKINQIFNAFLLDFELQNGSKRPPESFQKPSKSDAGKATEN